MKIETLKTKEDLKEAIVLGEYAFQYDLSDEEKDKRLKQLKPEQHYVIRQNGAIASKLLHLPMEVFFGDKRLKMGGVASVATWPEYRRGGMVKNLLYYALEKMRERGEVISMLHPFSVPYYRRFGWEMAFAYKKYTFSKLGTEYRYPGRFFRIKQEAYEELIPIYEAEAKKYSGMVAREDWWWKNRVFSEDDHIAIYENKKGQKTGYLIYHVKDEEMKIDEWVALDPEARQAIFTFINNHDSMIEKVTFIAPGTDDHLEVYLPDPRVKQGIYPYFMARVVDVEAFLKVFPYMASCNVDLALGVNDGFAEWNDGVYQIKIDKGQLTHLEKLDQYTADITVSIQTLAALFFGYMSAQKLAEYGLLEADNEGVLDQLQQMAGHRTPRLLDFF